ncbi:MAG: SRPBCC domain-containing protein [Flavobacteriales bacterium]|nr:SRPBCC domain-containing protein [Flavobacteriales bacterium]MBK6943767.1 SRPBCC domain-containing protein [Flavobacteriales bacterium]MBK7239979.1 SRPBCC domain-containing protein [Flavobacteriales bacterium]MBK7297022.1 SRPBCC domain-containing protein [Flavobacteriales bacterium]MBK9535701.1 SRPBCC domain-containing protein [Flavobacteriales bacterium]
MDTLAAQRKRNAVSTTAPDEIRITRVFNAPRQLVWNTWTTPAMLVHWFGCAAFNTTHAEADVHVGGMWRVVMVAPSGEEFPTYGTYLDVREPELLRLSHHWEKTVAEVNPARHSTEVTVELFDVDVGTRMEFRQTGLASIASRDSHIGGWCDSFDALHQGLISEGQKK